MAKTKHILNMMPKPEPIYTYVQKVGIFFNNAKIRVQQRVREVILLQVSCWHMSICSVIHSLSPVEPPAAALAYLKNISVSTKHRYNFSVLQIWTQSTTSKTSPSLRNISLKLTNSCPRLLPRRILLYHKPSTH